MMNIVTDSEVENAEKKLKLNELIKE